MVCCGRNNGTCVCAQEAKCSCGKQPALQCTCDKAATENKLPTDSSACACGKRTEDACNCGRAENNGSSSLETDFTTSK
ncbi:uncharacterized protein J4E88_001854 [Alternaria novae-zelandiae]|uniref:uncharacterized protein n=1 Tax=Alternaria metachromatica TaxID=283354 RepID=UPI0020C4831D|nr:uncharacterized protein J4E83_005657 [Alternaria metachromatica]XP_049204640.1 uncharacterized protein J4E93_000797 [Alternaria ventricosa]XP_049249470.1 uncharacterized protein J4E84_001319 [Alternaria hordeiaustralica]XP_049259386.1 uncharacterized protein J4E88_001854 [Alternaria novae-zelandiae]XP_051295320.1 uncharacterized protein J4E90_000236 [Alternaria incomplexa]XP_051353873.1 uncharacterized protein J4E92_004644 [Alternaria infectoria]KAI4613061.1 hypothetical protein J4E80_0071